MQTHQFHHIIGVTAIGTRIVLLCGSSYTEISLLSCGPDEGIAPSYLSVVLPPIEYIRLRSN